MSRYVDLDGLTWDGTKITSKIQEVQTKHGYMQGITVGWLWGDNVPHIDLEEHDAKIRADAIDECKAIFRKYMLTKDIEGLDELLEQLKEQSNTYTATVDGVKRDFM